MYRRHRLTLWWWRRRSLCVSRVNAICGIYAPSRATRWERIMQFYTPIYMWCTLHQHTLDNASLLTARILSSIYYFILLCARSPELLTHAHKPDAFHIHIFIHHRAYTYIWVYERPGRRQTHLTVLISHVWSMSKPMSAMWCVRLGRVTIAPRISFVRVLVNYIFDEYIWSFSRCGKPSTTRVLRNRSGILGIKIVLQR